MSELEPTAGLDGLTGVCQTIYHPTGSCRVVGPDFRVQGIGGPRIVAIVPAHPQAAVYALAERAAELVKASAAARRSSGS